MAHPEPSHEICPRTNHRCVQQPRASQDAESQKSGPQRAPNRCLLCKHHSLRKRFGQLRQAAAHLPLRLHRDQKGTISIIGVFTLLALVVLLGMVMNTGQQVDQKIKMQNAVDAATYSGGVVLARNMNSLAFTNQFSPRSLH